MDKANKYGFRQSDWERAKGEATNILIDHARQSKTIAYSELVTMVTAVSLEAHDQRFFELLGEISEAEDEAGRGMLSVLVVHKHGDMQPGPGFFDLAKALGRDTSDILECWVNEFKKVHAYWAAN